MPLSRRRFLFLLSLLEPALHSFADGYQIDDSLERILQSTTARLQDHGLKRKERFLLLHGREERLYLFLSSEERPLLEMLYPVSTGRNGFGNGERSGCTPTGVHEIYEKIGEGQPLGMVFSHRRPTGEIKNVQSQPRSGPHVITTRILWLSGLEQKNANTLRRTIYIHGVYPEDTIGRPASGGCIRMRNSDILNLYSLVSEHTLIDIVP